MARTQIRGGDQIIDDTIDSADIKDGEVWREDLNTTSTGKAVVRKIVAGTNITLDSTGVDAGTGDVTINASGSSEIIYSNGFLDDDRSNFSLSYDYSTRVLTLSHSSDYSVYVQGTEYVKTADVIATAHTNAYGMYFYYFDNTGSLITSDTVWDLELHAAVALVIFNPNATDTIKGFVVEERHGVIMDWATHELLHSTYGTQYISGLGIADYNLDSDTIADTTYSIATGIISDEDIRSTITAQTDGSNYTLFFRNGTSGDWDWITGSSTPYYISNNNITYNQWTGSTWQLTELSSNNTFMNHYHIVVPAISSTFQNLVLIGQAIYTTETGAISEEFSNTISRGNLPLTEFSTLYKITSEYASSSSITTGKSSITSVSDVRGTVSVIGINPSNDHLVLSNLNAGPYLDGGHTNLTVSEISANSAPAVTDDVDNYKEGSIWIKQDTDSAYICTDNTDGAAVWKELGQNVPSIYATITSAEAASGSDNDLCYVVETESWYRYESSGSAYTDDNTYILSTGDAGDTRWLSVAGKYNYKYKNIDFNTYDGYQALYTLNTSYSTAYGYKAGYSLSSNDEGNYFGVFSGKYNIGKRNIVIGSRSGLGLSSLSSYQNCLLIGTNAGQNLTSGVSNLFLGSYSGLFNTTGTYNLYAGHNAGYSYNGSYNIALGGQAMQGGTTPNEISSVDTVADSSGSLSGTYFVLVHPTRGTYWIWYDVDNGSTPPTPSSEILIEVDISANDTADTVAANTELAIENIEDFPYTVAVSSNALTIYSMMSGSVTDVADGASPTGFTFGTDQQGTSSSSPNHNIAINYQSLYNITSGQYNIALGTRALQDLNTANGSIALGYESGYYCTTSNYSFFAGYQAGYGNSGGASGDYNIGIGYQSIFNFSSGIDNICLGKTSGYSILNGTGNIYIGYQSGYSNQSGNYAIIIGYNAGYNNSASQSVYIGFQSGYNQTSEAGNTYVGSNSGFYSTGTYNTILGRQAFFGVSGSTTGDYNIAIGYQALYISEDAIYNTVIGTYAGNSITSGSSNCLFGYNTDVSSASDSNSVIIGSNVQGTASAQIRIGNSNVTTCFIEGIYGVTDGTDPYVRVSSSGQLRQDSSSLRDKENIKNLIIDSNNIYKLQPKQYTRISSGKSEIGYIAEDVVKFLPEVVGLVQEKKVISNSDSEKLIPNHINYEKIIIPLVEEIKKLKLEIQNLKLKLLN